MKFTNLAFSAMAVAIALIPQFAYAQTADGAPVKTTVWAAEAKGSGRWVYRIPSVCTFGAGSDHAGRVVALCDNRGDDWGDLSNDKTLHVVAKVSDDNGATWSDEVIVAPNLGTTNGDPSMVYDASTGKIIAMFNATYSFSNAYNSGDIYMTSSSDGLTWETPKKVTTEFSSKVTGFLRSWANGFVSSGNLLYDNGRIWCVVVMRTTGDTLSTKGWNLVYYSDDHGNTWSLANTNWRNQDNPVNNTGNEGKLLRLSDGSLLMSLRHSSSDTQSTRTQRFFTSTDQGATWTNIGSTGLLSCGSNSDIVKVNHNGKEYIVCVIATKDPSDAPRQNIVAYFSMDNGKTWQGKNFYNGYAGYVSLTVMQNGALGALIETGPENDGSTGPDGGSSMDFFPFTMDWLLALEENFDGTLDCDGHRYVEIPNCQGVFDVKSGSPLTVTFRFLARDFNSDYRLLGNRGWDGNSKHNGTATFGGSSHWSNYYSGFDIHMYAENQTLGSNGSNKGDRTYKLSIDYTPNAFTKGYPETSIGEVVNTWRHVALVLDPSAKTQTIYVDGVKLHSYSGLEDMTAYYGMLFGAEYKKENSTEVSMERIFNGKMDDIRFYRAALTDGQIYEDMASGFPLDNVTLIAAYDFEDIDTQAKTITDISGNGHTAYLRELSSSFPVVEKTVTVTTIGNLGNIVEGSVDGHVPATVNDNTSVQVSVNADFRIKDGATATGLETYVRDITVNDAPYTPGEYFKVFQDTEIRAINAKKPAYLVYKNPYTGEVSRRPFLYVREDNSPFDADNSHLPLTKATYRTHNGNHYELALETDDTPDFVVYGKNNDIIGYGLAGPYIVEIGDQTLGHNVATYYAASPATHTAAVGSQTGVVQAANVGESLVRHDQASSDTHFVPASGKRLESPCFVLEMNNEGTSGRLFLKDAVSTGVEDIAGADAQEVEVVLFNLQGVRVYGQPAPGVYLRRATFTDGSTRTVKVQVR